MCGGIAGIGAQGHFKRAAGFVQLVLVRVDNAEIYEWLWKFWKIFRHPAKSADCLSPLARIALHQAFKESHLCVARLGTQKYFCLGQSLNEFSIAA